MDIEFLIGLGISEEVAERILNIHESELIEAEKKRISDKVAMAVKNMLENEGTVNFRAAAAVLDFEHSGDDFESEPVGLADAVSKLKAEAPYLFRDKSRETQKIYTFTGITPAAAADTEAEEGELTYSEYMRMYR